MKAQTSSSPSSSSPSREPASRRWLGRVGLVGLLIAGLWFACERRTYPIRDSEVESGAAREAAPDGPKADAPKVNAQTGPTNATFDQPTSAAGLEPMVGSPPPWAPPASASPSVVLSEEQIIERRAQLKASLAGLYTAQRAFHAEFDRYSTDLKALGWSPASPDLPAYIGFMRAFDHASEVNLPDGEVPGRLSTDAFVGSTSDADRPYRYDSHSQIAVRELERHCRRGCTASRDRFELISAFNLDADPTLDVWIINESKELVHVVDDERE